MAMSKSMIGINIENLSAIYSYQNASNNTRARNCIPKKNLPVLFVTESSQECRIWGSMQATNWGSINIRSIWSRKKGDFSVGSKIVAWKLRLWNVFRTMWGIVTCTSQWRFSKAEWGYTALQKIKDLSHSGISTLRSKGHCCSGIWNLMASSKWRKWRSSKCRVKIW